MVFLFAFRSALLSSGSHVRSHFIDEYLNIKLDGLVFIY